MRAKLLIYPSLVGVVAAGVCVSAAQVQATPGTATSTVLAQSTFPSLDINAYNTTIDGNPWRAVLRTKARTDGYVVDNKFEPGQTTGWHSHPGPSLIFVVSGSVTNYESSAPGCAGVTYRAGQSFIDAGGTDVHMVRNDGTAPAETIAVQFIANGQLRRVDQPVPPGCNS